MKKAAYYGGALGLGLLVALVIHADFSAMLSTLESGGWQLLWLLPYRVIFFLFYAVGWWVLLSPSDPRHHAGLGYLLWVTTVREAVDRLLPVASVGGSVIGIRLVRWRGLAAAPVGASVVVEILLTLIASYIFTAAGLFLWIEFGSTGLEYRRILLFFLLSLPLPLMTVLLVRYGSVFKRLHRILRPLVGSSILAAGAEALDIELLTALQQGGRLVVVGTLQLVALVSGSFEIWFALRLFGHPVGAAVAIALEAMTLAIRLVAFAVPASLGVQEAGLILFGHTLGLGGEFALAVSLAKRLREVSWAIPALISWQWAEGRRLTKPAWPDFR